MVSSEYTEDEMLCFETMKKIKQINLNKDNLNLLNGDEILFIMNCNEEMDFFDKYKIYYSWNKYNKDITEEDIYEMLHGPKGSKYKNKFIGINLGLGHCLEIRTDIYDEYMKILKSDIIYEDEFNFEHIYAAWNHWVDCAIKYIDKSNIEK